MSLFCTNITIDNSLAQPPLTHATDWSIVATVEILELVTVLSSGPPDRMLDFQVMCAMN